ncbi:unnamed protein product, partial [Closterium sp. NIES-53]
FYHPISRRVFPSQDITFDESVPFYHLFPYRSAPPPPPPLFLAPGPPPVDPLPPQGPAPLGVSQVDPLSGPVPVQTGGGEPGGAEPEGVEPGGAASEGAESGGAGVAAGAGVPGGIVTTGPRGARTRGTAAAGSGGVEGAGAGDPTESGATGAAGSGAGGAGAGGAGVGGPGVGSARARGAGAVDPGGAVRPRPYFIPLLQQVLGTPYSTGLTPPLLCPPPDQSQQPLQPASPLPAPSPYTEQSGGLRQRREPASHRVLWGDITMVDAERRLVEISLLDPDNLFFTLVSERRDLSGLCFKGGTQ